MNPRGSPWQCLDMRGSIRPHQWHFFTRKREKNELNWVAEPTMFPYIWKSLCIHWLLSVVPPHKAYIFRFKTPYTHLTLIHASFWGVPPPVPIRFWQKVRGWPPSIHLKKCRSTPLTPEPVGVGHARMILPVIMAQAETVRGTEMFQESCNSSVPRLNWSKASVNWLAAVV